MLGIHNRLKLDGVFITHQDKSGGRLSFLLDRAYNRCTGPNTIVASNCSDLKTSPRHSPGPVK